MGLGDVPASGVGVVGGVGPLLLKPMDGEWERGGFTRGDSCCSQNEREGMLGKSNGYLS